MYCRCSTYAFIKSCLSFLFYSSKNPIHRTSKQLFKLNMYQCVGYVFDATSVYCDHQITLVIYVMVLLQRSNALRAVSHEKSDATNMMPCVMESVGSWNASNSSIFDYYFRIYDNHIRSKAQCTVNEYCIFMFVCLIWKPQCSDFPSLLN